MEATYCKWQLKTQSGPEVQCFRAALFYSTESKLLAGAFRRVLAAERAEAEAVAVFLHGYEEFRVRPGAPTIVASEALLFQVEVKRNEIAVR
jgi:hypothetical protein